MKLFETYVGEDIMYPCSPAGSSRVVSVFAGAMVAALHVSFFPSGLFKGCE
jgi:hypothetical protein